MKKFIGIFISVIMLFCAVVPMASAATPAEEAKLQFNEDGTFKILNISDIQDGANLMALTEEFMTAAIEAEQPDLIILTGDNIAGYQTLSASKSEKAIREVMNVLDPYGIPVAIVFGNHDDDGAELTKEEQMVIYSEYDCFIGYDEGADIYGCGTYNIPVYSSTDASDIVFNCWLFDSGSYDENGGYDRVRESQLEWYKAKSAELAVENGGEVVPAIAFQHIIVPEIFDALTMVDSNVEGSVPKYGNYYVLPENAGEGSILGEAPCPSAENDGEFDTLVECGGVMAVISGHDHVNSFVVPYKGIDLINTPTCGFRSYGTNETRGIRVFELSEDDLSTYETRIVTFPDYYSDNAWAMFRYDFMGLIGSFITFFSTLWTGISSSLGI